MNAETVKKQYAEELLHLQLAGMANSYEEERKNKEELNRLEREHQWEMSRLQGQKDEEQYKIRTFESKREEELRRHQRETQDLERRNKRAEEELRDQKMKQFKECLRESTLSAQNETNQLQELLNSSLILHENFKKIEEVKKMKKTVLEVHSKWMNVKDAYDLMKEIYFMVDQIESFDAEAKKSFLGELGRLFITKDQLLKHLVTARKSLGKWKPVADEQCYQDVDSGFDNLSAALGELEKVFTEMRKDVKENKPIEESFLSKIDLVLQECHILVNNLMQNPMTVKTTFQQMIEN